MSTQTRTPGILYIIYLNKKSNTITTINITPHTQVVLYCTLWNCLGLLLNRINADQLGSLVRIFKLLCMWQSDTYDNYSHLISTYSRLGLPCLLVPSTYFAVTLAGSMGMMGMW